jgi:uncharacterized membrane protein
MRLVLFSTLVFSTLIFLKFRNLENRFSNLENRVSKLEKNILITKDNLKDSILVTRYKKDGCEQLLKFSDLDDEKS